LYLRVANARECALSPFRLDVYSPRRLDGAVGRRLQHLLPRGDPPCPESSDPDLCGTEVDVLPLGLCDLDTGEEELGVPLCLEAPLVGLCAIGAPVADAIPPPLLRRVGVDTTHSPVDRRWTSCRPASPRRVPSGSSPMRCARERRVPAR